MPRTIRPPKGRRALSHPRRAVAAHLYRCSRDRQRPDLLCGGGRFGLGSVTKIRIALTEELRTREYSQRLDDLARNVLTWEGASVGSMLYLAAAQGGAQTLRRDAGASHEAALADLTAIDSLAPVPQVKFQIPLVRSEIAASGASLT
jgi:hypothetical protein